MSIRVLAGEAGGRAEPMVWPRVRPGATAEAVPEGRLVELQIRIAELENQARQREEQAYQSGLREGQALGQERAGASLEPVVARLAQTIEELAGQRRRMRREAEEDVVKLALAIGRRVLHRELSIDPEALLGVVKAALAKLERQEVNRVRVHPSDSAMVKRHFEQLDLPGPIEVVADSALERGAVVFETPRGNLDASLETQLLEIQRGLSDRLRGGRQDG
jgi:flagellar assembly protein FliH